MLTFDAMHGVKGGGMPDMVSINHSGISMPCLALCPVDVFGVGGCLSFRAIIVCTGLAFGPSGNFCF